MELDPIKLTSSLKLSSKNVNKEKRKNKIFENELDVIIESIENIIKFSYANLILAIYINSTFWTYLLKQYNIPDLENINNCYMLRELFKKYKNLINEIYKEEAKNFESNKKKKDNKNIISIIINDVNRYYERDEFEFILISNIKGFFDIKRKKEKIRDLEIIGAIEKFNPYYNIKDKDDNMRYKNNLII